MEIKIFCFMVFLGMILLFVSVGICLYWLIDKIRNILGGE